MKYESSGKNEPTLHIDTEDKLVVTRGEEWWEGVPNESGQKI